MTSFIAVALSPQVRTRALKVALVVGTILNLINQGDVLLAGTVNVMKALVTYLVPYCVATYSAASAICDRDEAQAEITAPR